MVQQLCRFKRLSWGDKRAQFGTLTAAGTGLRVGARNNSPPSCHAVPPAVVMPDSDPASREYRRHWIAGRARNDNFCVVMPDPLLVMPDLIRHPGSPKALDCGSEPAMTGKGSAMTSKGPCGIRARLVIRPVLRCAAFGLQAHNTVKLPLTCKSGSDVAAFQAASLAKPAVTARVSATAVPAAPKLVLPSSVLAAPPFSTIVR